MSDPVVRSCVLPREERISLAAERIYRVANFAPGDREAPLTRVDEPGLSEVRAALGQLLKEQDRDTRHACAAAVSALPDSGAAVGAIDRNAAHAACMNVRAV